MDLQQRTRRFGAYMILCACLLRFFTGGLWKNIVSETGQSVRFLSSSGKNLSHFRESPAPWVQEDRLPVFTAEDAASIEMDYDCALRPDLETLLSEPLRWDLTKDQPAVLILHTHTTESYTKAGEDYAESSDYRTLSEEHNMISIGDALAAQLEQAGISVLHDREFHDYPSYNGAYIHARESTEQILQQYPSLRLILDLHRDALEQEGRQLRTAAEVNGIPSAQLMMVVGTNVSRQAHQNWEKNLSLALKLHLQLERQNPGIMRPVNLRQQRFNQDLSDGALLIEVGAAGNSRAEALAAASALGDAIIALARGSQ